jgi:chitin synthase
MADEDDECLIRSLHGVMNNIAHLCQRDRSKTWGNQSWKKVVVCIVSDGRAKVNSRALAVLAAMGVYQPGIAKTRVESKDVTAHIYEYTTQISITPSLKFETADKGVVPVQIIFCLKEKNQNKINSHRWFFNAFCPILQPSICVLLDVGTMPGPTSIYHLWKAFDIEPDLGGACGEITVHKGQYGTKLLNPLVAAQNFEYKMSTILGKAFESLFGYITVMPSAFSAYRYIALQDNVSRVGDGPLSKYFSGETSRSSGGMFTAVAEDHILAWEIVSKHSSSWVLHYVKSAYATRDVPSRVSDLISGRRWLNAFFAAIHSTSHFYYIHRSAHSFLRKFWIHVELLYQFCSLIVSWFTLVRSVVVLSSMGLT